MSTPSAAVGGPGITSVVRRWRVQTDDRSVAERCAWWLWLSAAIAAWPGPLLTIERRFSVPAPDGPVVEHLIASVAGAELFAGATALDAELSTLVDSTRGVELVPESVSALDPWHSASAWVHELRSPRRDAVRSVVAGEALSRAVRSLHRDGRRSSIGVLLGSPPALRPHGYNGEEALADAIRFRLRLASEGPPRLITVAMLGTALGASEAAWLTPRTPDGRRWAAHAYSSSTTEAWEPAGSLTDPSHEVFVAPETGAEIASLPLLR